jgi:hypothetical protein
LKVFASELVTLIPLISAFCADVLQPAGVLLEHINCWLLLHDVVSLLKTNEAPNQLALLQRLVEEHHQAFCNVYGAAGAKPKLHYMLHLAATVRLTGDVMACFVTERKHRGLKQQAAQVFRNFETTLTTTEANRHLNKFLTMGTPRENALVNPRELDAAGAALFGLSAGGRARSARSATLAKAGTLSAGDIIEYGANLVGKVTGFVEADIGIHVAVVRLTRTNCLCSITHEPELVDARHVLSLMFHQTWNTGQTRVLSPWSRRQ